MLISPTHRIPFVRQILTHESPDLDAIVSVWLLQQYGNDRLPGLATAAIQFVTAGKLPDGKTAAQLEAEGIIAVDTGGGRFDTHPTNENDNLAKRNLSATDLVARFLDIETLHPYWKPFLEYVRQQDTKGHSLHSSDYLHHLCSIHTILAGIESIYPGESLTKMKEGMKVIACIFAYLAQPNTVLPEQQNQYLLEKVTHFLQDKPHIIANNHGYYNSFLTWLDRLRQNAPNAFSTLPNDDIVSLRSIVLGSAASNKDEAYPQHIANMCLHALLLREEQWASALQDFEKNAVVRKINKIHVVTIASTNNLVIKAARFKTKGDLILYQNPETRATTVLINRKGSLHRFSMQRLATLIRIAEATETGETINHSTLGKYGDSYGWFLHQSDNFIIKGSNKAPDFIPTRIPLSDLSQILYHCLVPEDEEMPQAYQAAQWAFRLANLKKALQ